MFFEFAKAISFSVFSSNSKSEFQLLKNLEIWTTNPSTNRSRMLEFVGRHSFIPGKFVDGLKKQQNQDPWLSEILDLELLFFRKRTCKNTIFWY